MNIEQSLVSIMVVTMDRHELASRCVPGALANCGHAHEFLACDNGSRDRRVVDLIAGLKPVYHRLNETNEGYAPMLNQMILRAKGEFLCVIDPDIELPAHWLAKLVEANRAIPESGLASIHCVLCFWPPRAINGIIVHPGDEVFGVKFFHRRLLDKVGWFCEDYVPYGVEDADYNLRCRETGLLNYYVDGMSANHLGGDCGDGGPYRRMKDESLKRVGPIFWANRDRYRTTGNYYVGPPEMR